MTPLHFLLLEDSLLDAELIQATLIEGGIDCELVQVQTQAEFLAALETQVFDLILSDYALPGFDGIAALETVRSADPEIPFILVSGTLGEELAIETLKSGATDYVLKQRLGRLVPSVQRALREAQERRDRRQAETALRLSENRYQTLANAVPQLMWMSDATGQTNYFNERWQTYTGLSVEAFLNLNWFKLIHPDDIQSLISAGAGGLKTTEAYELECRVKRFDRVYRWHLCRVVPLKDEQGQVLSWFGTATDIDDIKQAEAGQRFLAEASAILTASLDYKITLTTIAQLTVPFLADLCFFDLVTPDGKIQPAAWHHSDAVTQDCFEQIQNFVPQPEFTNHPTANVIATGKATFMPIVTDEWKQAIALNTAHLQFMHELQLASLIAVPLVAHDLRLGVLTCCFTAKSGRHYTATELHLIEELAHRAALALDNAQLYQQAQESNRIKDEFLAVLSHELRTPLNPILGWSKLLRSKYQDKVTLMRGLETIERNAQTQTQLIEDLLDVSRILRGKLSLKICPVNLLATIQSAIETVQLAAEAKAINLRLEIKELNFDSNAESAKQIPCAVALETSASNPQFSMLQSSLQVMGDPNRLQQVVWNILSNAVKFTPQSGRVDICLERFPSTPPLAQITVTDTGKGIPNHFLPYIFDYFRQADGSTTRNFGGLGLGLAIVRHLVELHGGTIQAASPGEGQGATFTVRLPLLVEATPQTRQEAVSPSPSLPAPPPLAGLRILLVDDEKDTLEFMTFLLREAGAIAVPATSAREALATLEQVNPHLLLSDIGMPEEDGYMLLRQVRSLTSAVRNVPAIALTAYAREEDRQQAIAAGFQSHLTKPIEPEELITAITDLLTPLSLLKITND